MKIKEFLLIQVIQELCTKYVEEVFTVVKLKEKDDKIIFLKLWNEWGKGNYMEPNLKFGKQYIEVLGFLKKSLVLNSENSTKLKLNN